MQSNAVRKIFVRIEETTDTETFVQIYKATGFSASRSVKAVLWLWLSKGISVLLPLLIARMRLNLVSDKFAVQVTVHHDKSL